MILIDANVLMYAAGTEHPNKAPSLHLLERVAKAEVDAAVDAEVLQEILHRYRALERWQDGRKLFDLVRRALPEVLPITSEVLDATRSMMDRYPQLMARDALHASVVQVAGLEAICSYDRDFDAIDELHRVEPDAV